MAVISAVLTTLMPSAQAAVSLQSSPHRHCAAQALHLTIGKSQGVSASGAVVSFFLHNTTEKDCSLKGFPKVRYLGKHKNVKPTHFKDQGDSDRVSLSPHHKAEFTLEIGELTKHGKECPKSKRVKPHFVSVKPPGSQQALMAKTPHPNKLWTCNGYGVVGSFTAPS